MRDTRFSYLPFTLGQRTLNWYVISILCSNSWSHSVSQIDTLDAALASNTSLRLQIHLDFNRSTRPGSSPPAYALLPLIKNYPDRVHVSLFRSPRLKGLMAKFMPPRFNEGWGTWHPKIYNVDDDVMISG